MNKEFKLPDVGEGLTEADIVSWHVKPGDTVTINQVLVEIETAKAVVELPSPYAGTVSALLVSAGQTVDVGSPIITIDVPVAGEAPATERRPGRRRAAAAGRDAGCAAPAAPARPPAGSRRLRRQAGLDPAAARARPCPPGRGPTRPRPRRRPTPPQPRAAARFRPSSPASSEARAEPPSTPRVRPRLLRTGPQGGPGGMGGGSPPCRRTAGREPPMLEIGPRE